ncbi:MAG: FKBP-type peptidyl-prolyl cis-trans isomerase [Candidatus Bathyarchaeia archaeon]
MSEQIEEVKKGDFALINYVCKVEESGEIVDTTIEEEAKKAGLYKEGTHYKPLFIIVGEGWVPKGLDESLIGLTAGKTTVIKVPPEKGYGVRDPSKIKLIPLRKFKKEGLNPTPGMHIEIDNKPALIRAVGAGRVQVDFNHPLSGRTLIYEVSIEKILKDNVEKVKALISRRIPDVSEEKFKVGFTEDSVDIELPEEAFFIDGIQLAKRAIAFDILKYFNQIKNVLFIDSYEKKGV